MTSSRDRSQTPHRELRPLRLGIGQFDARSGDFDFNSARHVELIEQAAGQQVDLIVFPELSLPGYASDVLDRAPDQCIVASDNPRLVDIQNACRANGIAAILGACLTTSDGAITLSSLVLGKQGETCGRYDKEHLDERESGWFTAGQDGCIVTMHGWRFGLSICYDSSFPEHARAAALHDAHGYLVSGAFPVGESSRRRSIYLPARALENTFFVAFANYCGSHAGLSYCGRSSVFGPDGRTLAEATVDDEALVVVQLEYEALRAVRSRHTMLLDTKACAAPRQIIEIP